MSNTADIPRDIWEKACMTIMSGYDDLHSQWLMRVDVARTLMAERERCAKLAEEKWLGAPLYPDGEDIAKAIRAGS